MHDAIWTGMDKVVISRVQMAVNSITGSSRHQPKSEVLYPDQKDLGNAGNIPLMSVSSLLDLNTNQDTNDETRDEENIEDGNFLALRSDHDGRAQGHQRNAIDFLLKMFPNFSTSVNVRRLS